ncbi:MAG TPA: tRNA (adenosine(37)-N6)-threonylcarbamoyltransferase complex dimerization subunit type 1 TsaB [Geminicoccaceae bacterium]|nr:tRNA (adenosine(37)-N6)-threonylcarbamoyltransferase complex dimerization subunit type 1 TsaB [Geminicoccus sp.]HMU48703.1 tRNA (adenosine(37)-N6)-threonylcarbamoyltransferase complex dimerization subunit type 1 TsaB [Geminicoccaceae bacterium]
MDTATARCSVAACDGRSPVASLSERLGTGHAERLVPMLAEVMAGASWSFDEVELVAVTLGPGSFTGIRAGVAAARALALATGRPAMGVSTLEAMSAAVEDRRSRTCVLRGRQGTVYAQRFAVGGLPVTQAAIMPENELAGLVGAGDVVLTDGALGLEGAIEVSIDGTAVARAALARIGRGERPADGTALRPLYMRDSGARIGAGRPLVGAA